MVSSIFLLFCEFDGIHRINIISFFQPRRLGLDPWALRMQERDQAITGHKTKQQVSAIILKFSKHYMLTSSPSIIVYNFNLGLDFFVWQTGAIYTVLVVRCWGDIIALCVFQKVLSWTPGLPDGVLSNHPCGPSVCPSVFKYLRDCSLVGVQQSKKSDMAGVLKKNLNSEIKGD